MKSSLSITHPRTSFSWMYASSPAPALDKGHYVIQAVGDEAPLWMYVGGFYVLCQVAF